MKSVLSFRVGTTMLIFYADELPIAHLINGVCCDFIAPRHRRSRNQLLRIRWQIIKQCVAAFGIEFAENVVNQKQWRFPVARSFQRVRLRDFHCQHNCPLLPFRGELRRR